MDSDDGFDPAEEADFDFGEVVDDDENDDGNNYRSGVKNASSSSSNSSDPKKIKAGSFASLGLDKELLRGIARLQYKSPTPVQRKALPIALAGIDLVVMARTGSGKTCVFLVPMIQRLKKHNTNAAIRGVLLSPTRELAMQTLKFAKDMAKFTDLRFASIVGGESIDNQFDTLASKPDVIVATPGRLMHLLQEITTLSLKHVQYLVFDEADRLFEMGFAEQLNSIVHRCPPERQTLLFSATMPKMLVQFSRAGLRDPQFIRLDTDVKMSEELRLGFLNVRSNEKLACLLYLVREIIPYDQQSIVFTATKHHSEFIHNLFELIGVGSTVIYGSMDQEQRTDNLKRFRTGGVRYLIVTDLAARGIDVPLLNNVINFHFPASPKLFVHRCGRAARQGRIGFAFSIIEPEELPYVADVHKFLGHEMCNIYSPGDDENLSTLISNSSSNSNSNSDSNSDSISKNRRLGSYTLKTMTPEHVHMGIVPQDCLDGDNEFVKKVLLDDQMQAMWRVSENGMQQYKRTRSEATKNGVRAAKALVKSDGIRHIHPLILGCDPGKCSQDVIDKANFIRMLQTFRPSQTVFETGIGGGITSAQIKNISKAGSKESQGAMVMKALRSANSQHLERNRKKLSAIDSSTMEGAEGDGESGDDSDNDEGEDNNNGWDFKDYDEAVGADEFSDVEVDGDDDGNDGSRGIKAGGKAHSSASSSSATAAMQLDNSNSNSNSSGGSKPRLSIAEKKRMKKQGLSTEEMASVAATKRATDAGAEGVTVQDNSKVAKSFQDPRFYMSYGNEDERANFAEESLQPKSGLRSSEALSAAFMENAMLDISPEDQADMNRKKKITHWDEKKRKFVKQTMAEMAEAGKKGIKRLRSESGINAKTSQKSMGELYEKWKKKSRKEIKVVGEDDGDNSGPSPNVRYNVDVPSELKNVEEIRKMHKQKDKMKIKNMSKDKRAKVLGKKKPPKPDRVLERYKNIKVAFSGSKGKHGKKR